MEQAAVIEATMPNWKRRFFAIWGGQIFSSAGSAVASFALIWWLTIQTGSATVLAASGIATALPSLLLMPFAGACVDRWNRRLIMIVSDAFIALVSLWLAYVSFTHAVQPYHVVVAMLARSFANVFYSPAWLAATPQLVPPERLTQVAGLNSTLSGVLGVISAPLGALAVATLPLYGVMLIDVATAAIAIGPLLFVAIPQPPRPALAPDAAKPSLWKDVLIGLSYMATWPGLFAFVTLCTVLNFCANPPLALLPILVTRQMGGGAPQLATLDAVLSVGVIVGGLLLSAWGGFRRRMRTWVLGVFVFAVGLLLVAAAPSGGLWLAAVGMGAIGVALCLGNAPVNAILQATVHPGMQGRVFALVSTLAGAANPLSLSLAGPLADLVGVRPVFLASAAGILLCAAYAARSSAVFHLEDGQPSRQGTST